jgi:uncharacterized protein YggU (UPF0235/DUF167 family)
MFPVRAQKNHSILYIWATPGAAKERFGDFKIDGDGTCYWKIYVTLKAEDGKANQAIIDFLSKCTGIAKSKFTLIYGQTHRKKRMFVEMDALELVSILKSVTGKLF